MFNCKENITFEKLINNYLIKKVIDESKEFIEYYSEKIANFISILDPDNVLIGRNIVMLNDKFLNIFIDKIKKKTFTFENREIYIDYVSSKDFLTARGAAALVLHKIFSTKKGYICFLKHILTLWKRSDNMDYEKNFF